MKRLCAISLLVLALGACLTIPLTSAGAATTTTGTGYQAVINDWKSDGRIDGTYSLKDLRAARAHVSSDELQYSTLGTQLDAATAKAERTDQSSGSNAAAWLIPVIIVVVLLLMIAGAVMVRRRHSDDPPTIANDDPESGADT